MTTTIIMSYDDLFNVIDCLSRSNFF